MDKIGVLMSGLPGNMASIVAKHVLKHDKLELLPYALTGPSKKEPVYHVDGHSIELIPPERRDDILGCIDEYRRQNRQVVAVDYTTPEAGNENAEWYVENKIPFVMGTTGINMEKIYEQVRNSEISAVVASNMSPQIVVIQAMLESAAREFPGAFKGMEGIIIESHQSTKKDVSGTAKKMQGYWQELGVDMKKIVSIRDPYIQRGILGVPEQHLKGHGWHEHIMRSKEGDVEVRLIHNVNGRDTYAKGTIDAIYFLAKRMEEGDKGKVYSMIDVLKNL